MKAWLVAFVCMVPAIAAAQDAPAPPPDGAPAPAAPAQPTSNDPSIVLREANAAATGGDWSRVSAFVGPLLARSLEPSDLAEAHRLAGLAAFFNNQQPEAEHHFVAYLRIDHDGHLDPALYPPEVINFFNDVRSRHARELRPPSKRYMILAAIPPLAQFQNGDRGKAWVLTGLLGGLAVINITSYAMLRSWCPNPASTCDASGTNHWRHASELEAVNIISGISLIGTVVYGVWDGVRGYRRRTRELEVAPYIAPNDGGGVAGLVGSF